MSDNKRDQERDNLVDLQMTVTELMLKKAQGKDIKVTAQELNAMTKHLANNDITVHTLIEKDAEDKKDNVIEIELPPEMKKTQLRKVGD